jgi:drug/metabolite transporter (DMT)-like permease
MLPPRDDEANIMLPKNVTRGTALALMIVAPVLWSIGGVVTRHLQQAGAYEQVFWRSFFAFAFVFLFLLLRKENPWRAIRAAGFPGLACSVLWAVMFTAYLVALSLTSTANTLVIIGLSPLLTAVLARLTLADPVPLRTWIAIPAAAAGIAWMFREGVEPAHFTGMLVAAAIPLAGAINVVTLRGSAARVDLVSSVMLGAALSCLVVLPFTLSFAATPRDLGLLALLGVFQLGLPCVLLVIASRTLLAPELALLGLLEVVLGPLWAWLGAGEEPSAATLTGGAIVVAALAANELASLRLRSGSTPPLRP